MIQTLNGILTLEEFLKLPETKPASEYIDGQIIQKPMPQGKHSKLQGKLVTVINNIVEEQAIALALPELRCTFGGGRSIVPDVAVFVWDRIPLDNEGDIANTFNAHPDWTIEILSPEQSTTKVTKKILHCLSSGCQMGWLIVPEEKSIFVYPSGQQPIFLEELDAVIPVPEFMANFTLTLRDIFSWLKLNPS
ncbi:Uma2 family endonuclease [Planktothrix mougeotii]|uniref:Uma2 family endonuclease n=1 Tax=Planktothrix mougeotii LEGE 06226 TaxID=1828728 RepID=A0ABR9UCS6_9CYAN|nr:Uma2 family endonuclease [Planktothrix mougeotii]MBE9143369.1 Uma2 family endonuclease [Planktothrix mougeotii LEGE 06226]